MKKHLAEALATMVPTYPVNIAGEDFTLRFDVNINKTKKGIKLQFISDKLPNDIRLKQQLMNNMGTELQQKFGDAKLQVILDLENPYNDAIGFLIPLPSIATHIMELAFPEAANAQETEPTEPQPEPEKPQAPPADQAPEEPAQAEKKPAPLPKKPMAERKITFRDFL